MKKSALIILMLALMFSCARAPLKNNDDLMRRSKKQKILKDELSRESFFETLDEHLLVMKSSRIVPNVMQFGNVKVKKEDYLKSLEELQALKNSEINYVNYINENFDFFEVYGNEDWAEVMVTGYYEPWVSGSKEKKFPYTQALYKNPEDLVTVNLKQFQHRFSAHEKLGQLQGRLINNRLVPYYSRKEIDVDESLKNKNLELVYIDPIDAFFIQIQGSGVVVFENGQKVRVGYAGQNGHSYVAIGKFLKEHIPVEEMSMQRIREHLLTLNEKQRQDILNLNPSYVFFQELDKESLTFAGMQVSDGRTIATDQYLFPKGALAFLSVDEPIFKGAHDIVPSENKNVSRIVFDQDTGGAIRGPGRVDLFIGKGSYAAQKAGVMKNPGKLFYLVPKKYIVH